jgi:hypothetical protein
VLLKYIQKKENVRCALDSACSGENHSVAFLNILFDSNFLLLRPKGGLSFVKLGSVAFCPYH